MHCNLPSDEYKHAVRGCKEGDVKKKVVVLLVKKQNNNDWYGRSVLVVNGYGKSDDG